MCMITVDWGRGPVLLLYVMKHLVQVWLYPKTFKDPLESLSARRTGRDSLFSTELMQTIRLNGHEQSNYFPKMVNCSFNLQSTTHLFELKGHTEVKTSPPAPHQIWIYNAFQKQRRSAPRRWQVQTLSGKQPVGSRLQSKWEFLSGKE